MPGTHEVTITLTVPASSDPTSPPRPVPSVAHPGPSTLPTTGFAVPALLSLALVLALIGLLLCRVARGPFPSRRLS